MGGPGSGPVQAPKSVGDAKRSVTLTIASLQGDAMEAVKKLMATDPPDPATARWVIEMQEGRPKQQVALSGELTITDQLRGLSEADLAALLALVQKTPDSAARPEEK